MKSAFSTPTKRIAQVVLVIVALVGIGCTTNYVKRFLTVESPRGFPEGIDFPEYGVGVYVVVAAQSLKPVPDSAFAVYMIAWPKLETDSLDYLFAAEGLSLDTLWVEMIDQGGVAGIIRPSVLADSVSKAPGNVRRRILLGRHMISAAIDTLRVHLRFGVEWEGQSRVDDTVFLMDRREYRMRGIWKD